MTSSQKVPLTELADIHDYLREPVSQTERNKREGKYPYYGATGQVGWIDDFRQDGKYVLLGEDGAPFLDPHKRKAYIVEGKCWVNNHAHVLKGKVGVCDDEYLCFALNWADYSDAVTGSTRLKLPQGTMNRILVPKPPIGEQRRIAANLKAKLAELDTARLAAQTQVQEAGVLRNRLLQTAFESLLVNHRRQACMKDVCTISAGGTPSRGNAAFFRGDIPWVKTLDLNFGLVTTTEERITREAFVAVRGELLPVGTVMVAMYGGAGTIGKSAVLGIEACTNQAVCSLQPNDELLSSDFLHEWICYIRPEWMRLSGGNRKDPNINKSVVENMTLPLPTVAEQRRFVRHLQSQLAQADVIVQAAAEQLAEINRLPQRILAQAFDGHA